MDSVDGTAVQKEIDVLQRHIDKATSPPGRPEGAKPPRVSPVMRKANANLDFLGPSSAFSGSHGSPVQHAHHAVTEASDPLHAHSFSPEGRTGRERMHVRAGYKPPPPERSSAAQRAHVDDDARSHASSEGRVEVSLLGKTMETSGETGLNEDITSLEFEKDMHKWQLANISEENHKLRKANQILVTMLQQLDTEREQQQQIFETQQSQLLEEQQTKFEHQQRQLLEQQRQYEERQKQLDEEKGRILEQQRRVLAPQPQQLAPQPQQRAPPSQQRRTSILSQTSTVNTTCSKVADGGHSFQPKTWSTDTVPLFDPAYLSMRNKYLDLIHQVGLRHLNEKVAHAGMLPWPDESTSVYGSSAGPRTDTTSAQLHSSFRSRNSADAQGPSSQGLSGSQLRWRTPLSDGPAMPSTVGAVTTDPPSHSALPGATHYKPPQAAARTSPTPGAQPRSGSPLQPALRHSRASSPSGSPLHVAGDSPSPPPVRFDGSPPAVSTHRPPPLYHSRTGAGAPPSSTSSLSRSTKAHPPPSPADYSGSPFAAAVPTSTPRGEIRPAGSRPASPVPSDSASASISPTRGFPALLADPGLPPPAPPPRSYMQLDRPRRGSTTSSLHSLHSSHDGSKLGHYMQLDRNKQHAARPPTQQRRRGSITSVGSQEFGVQEDPYAEWQPDPPPSQALPQQQPWSASSTSPSQQDKDDAVEAWRWNRGAVVRGRMPALDTNGAIAEEDERAQAEHEQRALALKEKEWELEEQRRRFEEERSALEKQRRAFEEQQAAAAKHSQELLRREQEQRAHAQQLNDLQASIEKQTVARHTAAAAASPVTPNPRLEKPKKSPRGVMAM